MKSWKFFGIAGAILISLAGWSGIGQAQYNGAYIDQREAAQEQQIQHGVQSGALTPREAGRLEAEQQRIRTAEAQMRADGRLDGREKAALDQMQNKAQRDIYREKHDRQVAYPGYGHNYEKRYHHNNPWYQRRLAEREQRCGAGVPCGPNPGERGKQARQHREEHHYWNR